MCVTVHQCACASYCVCVCVCVCERERERERERVNNPFVVHNYDTALFSGS